MMERGVHECQVASRPLQLISTFGSAGPSRSASRARSLISNGKKRPGAPSHAPGRCSQPPRERHELTDSSRRQVHRFRPIFPPRFRRIMSPPDPGVAAPWASRSGHRPARGDGTRGLGTARRAGSPAGSRPGRPGWKQQAIICIYLFMRCRGFPRWRGQAVVGVVGGTEIRTMLVTDPFLSLTINSIDPLSETWE
jgi:hypothetical protein